MDGKTHIIIEDSIMQKGQAATAGSRILEGFIAPFDAAVVEKLKESGITVTSQRAMDEFGIDPLFSDPASDAPSAAIQAVLDDPSVMALCNDLSGRSKRQAALNGLCYITPTYGTVSRYGLIPSVSSMDQIGIVCADPAKGYSLLSMLAGKDERDGAMYPESSYIYQSCADPIRLMIPDHIWKDSGCEITGLDQAFEVQQCELDYYELFRQVFFILSCAELCNNTNRYDGVKFGYRSQTYSGINDLYVNTRSEAFGLHAKLAIIMGARVLSQEYYESCYKKAMSIRRLIRDSLALNLAGQTVLALPVRQKGTPYEQTALYAPAALAGLPSLTIPYGNSGLQLIASAKREDILLGAWEVIRS